MLVFCVHFYERGIYLSVFAKYSGYHSPVT